MGPHAPTRPGRHGHLVVEPAAASLAADRERAASGQHVHDLAHLARGRPELAKEPHLVRNRRGDAPAQARCGARQRSRCDGQKKLIEQAYTLGAQLGLSVWCEDEAGPFQAVPHSGVSWHPRGQPATQPHEYIRGGTTKILTLFHPATGQGAAAISRSRHQCGPAPVAARAPERDPGRAAPTGSIAGSGRYASSLGRMAGGSDEALHVAARPAAAAAVAGVGQPHRPQDARPGAVAVRAWRYTNPREG